MGYERDVGVHDSMRLRSDAQLAPNTSGGANCHPSYQGGTDTRTGGCIRADVGDYDCAGGSGNGPNYVRGPVYVVGPDVFDLDRDGDGIGCER